MSILGVSVAVQLPVVAGLLVGPGVAVHILVKQIFPQLGNYTLPLCIFSAVVSGAAAFAVIEGIALVSAVALAAFSVLLAYEHFHREQQRREPTADTASVLAAIQKLRIPEATNLEPVLNAIGKIQPTDMGPVLAAIQKLQISAAPDLQPVLDAIGKIPSTDIGPVLTAIQARQIPAAPDLQPVLDAIGKIPSTDIGQVLTAIQALKIPAAPALQPVLEKITQLVGQLTEALSKAAEANNSTDSAASRLGACCETLAVSFKETQNCLYVFVDEWKKYETSHHDQVMQKLAAFQQAGNNVLAMQKEIAGKIDTLRQSSEQAWGNMATTLPSIERALAKQEGMLSMQAMQQAATRSQSVPVAPIQPASSRDVGPQLMDAMHSQIFLRPSAPLPSPLAVRSASAWHSPGADSLRIVTSESLTSPGAASASAEALECSPPDPIACADPKSAVLAAGQEAMNKQTRSQRSLAEVFQEVNDFKVTEQGMKGFIPVTCHLSTQLTDAEWRVAMAAAIVTLLERDLKLVNVPVWMVPNDLTYSVGVGGLGRAVKTTTLSDKDKMSWLIFAGMYGLSDLVSYLISKGATPTFQKETRTFQHFAARAGCLDIVRKHYTDAFGAGGVPLMFDAACAPDANVLEFLISSDYSDAVNTPYSLTALSSQEFARFIRPGMKVTALHLIILRQDDAMLEALLQCKGLKGDVPAEMSHSWGSGSTPLLLLLDWISKKNLNLDHVAVRAAIQLITVLKDNYNYNRNKFTAMQGQWPGPNRRDLPTKMKWETLLSQCPVASQSAIRDAMST